jgi:hypothetical protein
MQVRVVTLAEGADGVSAALLAWEHATAGDGIEVGEQLVGVPVVEEETALARDNGFGEPTGAAAHNGDAAEDGFGRDEAERLGPERRRDERPSVGEPAVDGTAGLPAREFDGLRWGEGVGEGLEGRAQAAVTHDPEAGGGMGGEDTGEGVQQDLDTFLRFETRDADEVGVGGG